MSPGVSWRLSDSITTMTTPDGDAAVWENRVVSQLVDAITAMTMMISLNYATAIVNSLYDSTKILRLSHWILYVWWNPAIPCISFLQIAIHRHPMEPGHPEWWTAAATDRPWQSDRRLLRRPRWAVCCRWTSLTWWAWPEWPWHPEKWKGKQEESKNVFKKSAISEFLIHVYLSEY